MLRRTSGLGARAALAALVAAGLVGLVLVADNVPGGPVPAASASSTDGSLSGVVSEAGNAGTITPAVCVYAAAEGVPDVYDATTATNGTYEIPDMAAGQYSVLFDPTCKGTQTSTYATQYYNDVRDISAVTWVTVPAGGSVGGIDANLQLAGTISGVVVGSQSAPLQGVCVIAYDSVDGYEVGATTTAANGSYSVQLPSGGYLVQFDPTCRAINTYASQFYNGAPDAYAANVIEVTGEATQTVDATLQQGSTIEGTVVATGATSSAGICVFAYDAGGNQIGGVLTDANGTYQLTDLPAQTYRVVFDPTCDDGQPSDYKSETYGSLSVQAGQTVTGINGTLGLAACLVAPYVTTTSLPAGSVSSPYSATLQASGGTGPYTWTAVGLPTSLSLDAATGVISGTPSAPFDATVAVTATDSSQQPLASNPQQLALALTGPSPTTSSTTTTTSSPTSSTTTSSTTTSSTTTTSTTSTTTSSSTTTSTTSTTTTSTTVPAGSCPGSSGGGGGVGFPVVSPTTTTSTVPSTSTTTVAQTTTTVLRLPVLPPGAPQGAYAAPVTAMVTTGLAKLVDTAGAASANLSVPVGALPAGTTVSIAAVKDASALKSEVPAGQSYLTSFAVSWVTPDGTSPVASKPITMTITDPAIKAGDTIYALTSTGIRAVGTATTNGEATVMFTSDPAFVVAGVPRLGTVGAQGSLKGSSIQVGVSCAAGTRCTGTARLSVAVGRAGAKRNVLFAKGDFALNGGRAGHLSLSVSGAGRTLLRSGGGKLEELTGNLTIALLGGKKSEHRVVVR